MDSKYALMTAPVNHLPGSRQAKSALFNDLPEGSIYRFESGFGLLPKVMKLTSVSSSTLAFLRIRSLYLVLKSILGVATNVVTVSVVVVVVDDEASVGDVLVSFKPEVFVGDETSVGAVLVSFKQLVFVDDFFFFLISVHYGVQTTKRHSCTFCRCPCTPIK